MAPGHPPRHIRNASWSISIRLSPSISSGLLNRAAKLTSPFDSPDSNRDIGRIRSFANLPTPECMMSEVCGGTLLPVSINCPMLPAWSTSNLTASQMVGAVCHSSSNLGRSPLSRRLMLILAILMTSGSAIYNTLAACCSAVVVFPHHFAPSISTAPFRCKRACSISSTILRLYFFITVWCCFLRHAKI